MDEDPSMGLGSNPGLPLTSSETLGGFLILLASISCKMALLWVLAAWPREGCSYGRALALPVPSAVHSQERGMIRPILQMCKLRPRAGPHSSKVPP